MDLRLREHRAAIEEIRYARRMTRPGRARAGLGVLLILVGVLLSSCGDLLARAGTLLLEPASAET
jgi:hypothetical protein